MKVQSRNGVFALPFRQKTFYSSALHTGKTRPEVKKNHSHPPLNKLPRRRLFPNPARGPPFSLGFSLESHSPQPSSAVLLILLAKVKPLMSFMRDEGGLLILSFTVRPPHISAQGPPSSPLSSLLKSSRVPPAEISLPTPPSLLCPIFFSERDWNFARSRQ